MIDGLQRRLPGVGKEAEEWVGIATAHGPYCQQLRSPHQLFLELGSHSTDVGYLRAGASKMLPAASKSPPVRRAEKLSVIQCTEPKMLSPPQSASSCSLPTIDQELQANSTYQLVSAELTAPHTLPLWGHPGVPMSQMRTRSHHPRSHS